MDHQGGARSPIVDDALWQAVKLRQKAVKITRAPNGKEVENHFRDRRRPEYLFSGLTQCGCCGGGYAMISADLVGCSTARNKGTCSNRLNIRRDCIEARVLNALRDRLMDPALFAAFCEEFTKEVNQIRIEARTSLAAAQREIERIDRDLKKLVQAIKDGVPALSLKEELLGKEARKAELVQMLPLPRDHPRCFIPTWPANIANRSPSCTRRYRKYGGESARAGEVLRSLVQSIVLSQRMEARDRIDRRSAGILSVAANRDRGEPRGSSPPTPPYIRVRIRRFAGLSGIGDLLHAVVWMSASSHRLRLL